ncbi:hypothetical protein PPERSA_02052 [Pseudocohnilembus persalinus]|uniref:Uncharacterized protein n=1 Tax=Pseudocohnilembus persalinus TaxID=266149 RepID=A0A0V0QFA7_PSEPJ|nr:hypothetical protein PPERSA_02052 [Pseudocohnilembus persalinus]|eukprot:KRX00873.1 hypothetical protein PPERSA_02052 [Pseudocohnilembus persalinus]
MKFQTKRGVIIFLENFILPLHKGVTHYAKLTLAQKQFILKDLHEEQKKQLKNPIIYSAPPPQGQMQNITQKTQQLSNLQKVSNNNFNRSYNLNSNNNNNNYNINNNSDIMQIIQDNKFNRHQFVSNSLKSHPTLQILSDYEYKVLKEHEEKQKNQRQKNQKKNNLKENQQWIYKDEDLPSYQVIGIIKQPHNPMQNLSNQSDKFANFQDNQSKIAASEKQILKTQIQQEYEIQLDSDFIKQILTDKNFDSQQFKQQYETVLEIYQQIFALMNHFDQKFFFRSKSLEWAEKKYQFLTCGPEEQIKLLEKLSKALKI